MIQSHRKMKIDYVRLSSTEIRLRLCCTQFGIKNNKFIININ